MAHHMFNIDAEAKKYPAFDKALEKTYPEIEGKLFWSIGEMGLLGLPKKIIETVEQGLDGTDAEKEAVMIGALHCYAPMALIQETSMGSFSYGPAAQDVLNALAAQDKAKPHSEAAARAIVVSNIVLSDAALPMLDGSHMSAAEVDHAKAEQKEADKPVVPFLNAPKLEALYTQGLQQVFDAMAGKKPAAPAPAPRRRSGPAL